MLMAREEIAANEVRSGISPALVSVRAGFAMLVVSHLLAFAAASNLSASTARARRSITVKLSGVTYMVTAWLMAALFVLIWFLHARPAESWQAAGQFDVERLPDPASAILIKSALICLCLFIQSGCLAAIGFSKVRE